MCLSFTLSGQQSIDVLTISNTYGFPSAYDYKHAGKAKEYGGMFGLVLPIKLSEKTYWYNSVNYFYWNISNDVEMPVDIVNPINLHGIVIRTGLYHKFSKGHGIQLLFSPRLMSDFKNINGSHFQAGGTILYERKYHNNLTMAFGAMYNQELFGAYLVPLINLNWTLSERWSITGLLPVYSKISYKVTDKLSVGSNHFGLVTTYKLGDSAYNGDYIERRSIDLGLFARYYLGGNIYMEGRFGKSLDRSYAQYGADQKVSFSLPMVGFGDNRFQKNSSFHDGMYANLRLIYNIKIKKTNN